MLVLNDNLLGWWSQAVISGNNLFRPMLHENFWNFQRHDDWKDHHAERQPNRRPDNPRNSV